MYDGLSMKNGRLVNDRPTGISGIQEAIDIKKSMKKASKLAMYSEAVSLGVQKAELMDKLKGKGGF